MEYLIYSIILICGVILTVQLVKMIGNGLSKSIYKQAVIVIPIRKATADIEITVRNIVWDSEKQINILLANVDGTDDTLEVCRRLDELYTNVILCSIDEVSKILLQLK